MKKKLFSLALVLCFLLSMSAVFTPAVSIAAPTDPGATMKGNPNWKLTYEDQFDGKRYDGTAAQTGDLNANGINTYNWSFQNGTGAEYGIPGWGNGEAEFYREANAAVVDGQLVLTAAYDGGRWYSAKMRTHTARASYPATESGKGGFLQTYGRFEACIKVDITAGFWPAFWMMPYDGAPGWPAGGEIDIMELKGGQPTFLQGSIHNSNGTPSYTSYGTTFFPAGETFADFHVYAIEWEETQMRWYVDGKEYGRVNSSNWSASAFDHDFGMIMNLAIGGGYLGGTMPPTTSTVGKYIVDWVRVYEAVYDDIVISSVTPNPAQIQQGKAYNVAVTVSGHNLDWASTIQVGIEGYPSTFKTASVNGVGTSATVSLNIPNDMFGETDIGNYDLVVLVDGAANATKGVLKVTPKVDVEGKVYLVSLRTGKVVGSDDTPANWIGGNTQTTLKAIFDDIDGREDRTCFDIYQNPDNGCYYLKASNDFCFTIEGTSFGGSMVRPRTANGVPDTWPAITSWESLQFDPQLDGTIKIWRTGTDYAKRSVDVAANGNLSAVTGDVGDTGKFYLKPVEPVVAGEPNFTLNPLGLTFKNAAPQDVTVTSTGDAATGALTVSVSNGNFVATPASLASLEPEATATFSVKPAAGLAIPSSGSTTYSAVVTVSNGDITKSINVSYTIYAPPPANWPQEGDVVYLLSNATGMIARSLPAYFDTPEANGNDMPTMAANISVADFEAYKDYCTFTVYYDYGKIYLMGTNGAYLTINGPAWQGAMVKVRTVGERLEVDWAALNLQEQADGTFKIFREPSTTVGESATYWINVSAGNLTPTPNAVGDSGKFQIVKVSGPVEPPKDPADKDALLAAINDFLALTASDWTAASWADADAAYQIALGLYNDDSLTEDDQGDVDDATAALLAAIEALVPYEPELPPFITLGENQAMSIKLAVGASVQLDISSNLDDLVYSCATTYVVVSPSGVVTGIKGGMAVITVTSLSYPALKVNVVVTVS